MSETNQPPGSGETAGADFKPQVPWTSSKFKFDSVSLIASPNLEASSHSKSTRGTKCCQVCGVDLADAKNYLKRYRICNVHRVAPAMVIDGIVQRFCQQCGRMHRVEDFDSNFRTCRKKLAIHNARRRKGVSKKGRTEVTTPNSSSTHINKSNSISLDESPTHPCTFNTTHLAEEKINTDADPDWLDPSSWEIADLELETCVPTNNTQSVRMNYSREPSPVQELDVLLNTIFTDNEMQQIVLERPAFGEPIVPPLFPQPLSSVIVDTQSHSRLSLKIPDVTPEQLPTDLKHHMLQVFRGFVVPPAQSSGVVLAHGTIRPGCVHITLDVWWPFNTTTTIHDNNNDHSKNINNNNNEEFGVLTFDKKVTRTVKELAKSIHQAAGWTRDIVLQLDDCCIAVHGDSVNDVLLAEFGSSNSLPCVSSFQSGQCVTVPKYDDENQCAEFDVLVDHCADGIVFARFSGSYLDSEILWRKGNCWRVRLTNVRNVDGVVLIDVGFSNKCPLLSLSRPLLMMQNEALVNEIESLLLASEDTQRVKDSFLMQFGSLIHWSKHKDRLSAEQLRVLSDIACSLAVMAVSQGYPALVRFVLPLCISSSDTAVEVPSVYDRLADMTTTKNLLSSAVLSRNGDVIRSLADWLTSHDCGFLIQNEMTKGDTTPLHYAALKMDAKIVKVLYDLSPRSFKHGWMTRGENGQSSPAQWYKGSTYYKTLKASCSKTATAQASSDDNATGGKPTQLKVAMADDIDDEFACWATMERMRKRKEKEWMQRQASKDELTASHMQALEQDVMAQLRLLSVAKEMAGTGGSGVWESWWPSALSTN